MFQITWFSWVLSRFLLTAVDFLANTRPAHWRTLYSTFPLSDISIASSFSGPKRYVPHHKKKVQLIGSQQQCRWLSYLLMYYLARPWFNIFVTFCPHQSWLLWRIKHVISLFRTIRNINHFWATTTYTIRGKVPAVSFSFNPNCSSLPAVVVMDF